MRATSPPLKASQVWDHLITAITTVGSIGELLDDFFTPYSYAAAIAAGVTFVPPDKTIVMIVNLVATPQKLDVVYSGTIVKAAADLGATENGYIGATYWDGSAGSGYKNTDVGGSNIRIKGVSMG